MSEYVSPAFDPARARAVAATSIGTALVLIAYYALDRSRAKVFDPGPDPAMVIASTHIEYFWRLSICAWMAPVVAGVLWFAVRGREEGALRFCARSIVPVAVVAAVLSAVFP